jgi:PAS domain S-box-containing protein
MVLLTMAGATAAIAAVEQYAPSSLSAARYLAVVPVGVAAYARHGIAGALAMVSFFVATFVPGVAASYGTAGFQQATVDLVVFAVILTLFAYLSASIAAIFRTQRSLADTVRGQEELLDRTSDVYQVADYVLEEARAATDAGSAMLLLRSPIDERWEAIGEEGRAPLAASVPRTGQRQSVAAWLLGQNRSQILNDLEDDPRLIPPDDVDGEPLRCLLARPIQGADGALAALLVVINSQYDHFTRDDLKALNGLVTGAEKALKQAGVYARTDQALARRARQLGALQRAARELNATLDPAWILSQALSCALEITGGEASAGGAESEGLTPSYQAAGVEPEKRLLQEHVRAALSLERAVLNPTLEAELPPLLPDARSRLAAPIRRGDRNLGAIVVESPRVEAFDGQDLVGLAALASHAATALENARLFADVYRERQKSDLIVETMADGLLTVAPDGRVLSLNPAAYAMLGVHAAEPAGANLCDVLGCGRDPACRPKCRLQQAIAQSQGYRDDQWTVRTRSGLERVLALRARPMPAIEGAEGGLVIQIQDVTARAELDRFQRELIATFSHELRTPLTNINTIVSILSKSDSAFHDGLSREYLETLQAQTRRLSEFAERVLDVSRLDTGRWKLEARPLPVGVVIGSRVREWQTLLPAREFRVELPQKPGWIWADEYAVSTVLDNLIDNAAKYSPADSEIRVSVADDPSGYRAISVQDRGRGVPPERSEVIFERFYRANGSDSQDIYGHGLGLYIARKLVQAMGGRIWVESGPTDGSRFVFTLPTLSLEDQSPPAAQGGQEREG